MAAELHLAEDTLALHLLFERLEGLIDVVVANENLHQQILSKTRRHGDSGQNGERDARPSRGASQRGGRNSRSPAACPAMVKRFTGMEREPALTLRLRAGPSSSAPF